MDLADLGARSMFLTDLEFAELECLAEKIGSGLGFLGSRATWSSIKHPLSSRNLSHLLMHHGLGC
jgi:hypothetical protein